MGLDLAVSRIVISFSFFPNFAFVVMVIYKPSGHMGSILTPGRSIIRVFISQVE